MRKNVKLVVSLVSEQKNEMRMALLETNRPAQRPPERKNVKLVASLEIEQMDEVRVAQTGRHSGRRSGRSCGKT